MNDTTTTSVPVTDRTRLRRLPARGTFDRAAIYSVLDEAIICHIAFVADGQPYAIPTGFARVDDVLYVHGSPVSRMLRTLGSGIDMCVTVTLVDGLVLARSAFHHSMNYRSVVILGRARVVTERAEKEAALRAFTNHIVPDRWEEVRPVTEREIAGTSVLAIPIEEASAKARTGPPIDDEPDLTWPVWAGVVPVGMECGAPVPDAHVAQGVAPFDVLRLTRRG